MSARRLALLAAALAACSPAAAQELRGKPEKRGRAIVFERPDSLWKQCPADKRT